MKLHPQDGSSRLVNTCSCWLLGAAAKPSSPRSLSLSPAAGSVAVHVPLSDPDVSYRRGHSMTAMTAMTYIITEEHFSCKI